MARYEVEAMGLLPCVRLAKARLGEIEAALVTMGGGRVTLEFPGLTRPFCLGPCMPELYTISLERWSEFLESAAAVLVELEKVLRSTMPPTRPDVPDA